MIECGGIVSADDEEMFFIGDAVFAVVDQGLVAVEGESSLDVAHVQMDMKKGSVARLEVGEGLRPGAGRLSWLLPPKVLRKIR